MTSLILRAGWRQLTRYRGQWSLTVLAIAIGVAVVVAVDLANQSALRAFDAAHRVLAGEATHQLVAGPEGVPEAIYPWLRIERGIRRAAPVVEGRVLLPALGRAVSVLGVDSFAEGDLRAGGPAPGSGDIGRLMAEPATALLSEDLLQALRLTPGASVAVRGGGRTSELAVIGRLAGDQPALTDLLVVDVATAQELLGRDGYLSRIDLVLQPDEAAALRSALPPGLRLLDAAGQVESLHELTAAFRLNLTALSLLALLVGLFLIYNTLSFAVVRRRQMVGTLRAIGVTQREVMRDLLLEAALLGLIGALCGILLGVPLAQGLVRLVGRTVEALYAEQAVLGLVLAPASLIKALLLGVLGAVLAAWLPARESALLPPRLMLSRAALESGSRRWLLRAAAMGLMLVVAGGGLLAASDGLLTGFAGLFAVVLGAALWVPLLSAAAMQLAVGPLGVLAGTAGRLAGRGAVASLSRTGVAVTALAVAVAAVVGVGIMIQSFRISVSGWLEHTLRADVYLSVATGEALAPTLIERLRRLPQVAEVSVSRRLELPTETGSLQLWGLELGPEAWAGFQLLAGESEAAYAGFRNGGVIVSEPFAYRRRLSVGDSLQLPTRAGPRAFPIVAIYRDYGSDRGVVTLHADTLQRWFGDSPITGLGVYAAPAVPVQTLVAALQPLLANTPGVRLQSQQALKVRSLEIFDQTFAITNVLRLLAGLVAFAGILAALTALQLERAREGAVLRAIGFTPAQSARLVVVQSGLLGLMAGLCALPLGILLSGLLVQVILRRAFGWSMNFQIPAATLVEGVVLASAAALIAAAYPAWRSYRAAPAPALREEA
ncbi:MAG TPA: FtsX-like permease family protein [Gammaproteobacteria bacterium]|nr:FtsX-like permease family protein [Gammaproteobacteria bacterium]